MCVGRPIAPCRPSDGRLRRRWKRSLAAANVELPQISKSVLCWPLQLLKRGRSARTRQPIPDVGAGMWAKPCTGQAWWGRILCDETRPFRAQCLLALVRAGSLRRSSSTTPPRSIIPWLPRVNCTLRTDLYLACFPSANHYLWIPGDLPFSDRCLANCTRCRKKARRNA